MLSAFAASETQAIGGCSSGQMLSASQSIVRPRWAMLGERSVETSLHQRADRTRYTPALLRK
jgi:hypothetical protein